MTALVSQTTLVSQTAPVTLLALACTLGGLGYLAVTDPKRRRVFGLEARARPFAWPARIAVFAPGLALAAAGAWAALTIWLGAATVSGWGLAALPPGRAGRLAARLLGPARGLRQRPAAAFLSASRARKSEKVLPGSGSNVSSSTARPDMRSRRKERKSRRISHQATSSQTGP